MNIEMPREPFAFGSVLAATKTTSALTPLVMNILAPFSTQSVAVASRGGPHRCDVGARVGLGDGDGREHFARDDAG